MGSLNKIRAGEGTLERFMRRCAAAEAVTVSDKLDGLSALLVLRAGSGPLLYLQGDGVRGVDVSRAAMMIKGCCKKGVSAILRGELVLPLAATPEGSIGRSLVNGWMHRSLDSERPVPEELRNVHFVAYSVWDPAGLRRDEQFEWLRAAGFEIPWFQQWPLAEATEARALAVLKARREESPYPLDGIVIGSAGVPEILGGGEDKNPTDACAFKASLDDQKAETRVILVEWDASRTGTLIPRIQIEPVQIGGATIQWLSGHNAKAILEGRLGPGARVIVRRSGDVIPTLDEVLEAAAGGAALPSAGTWDWDESRTHAVARAEGQAAAAAPALLHCLQTLGVAGIGPGLVQVLVAGGLRTLRAVRDAPAAKLAELLGAGRGPTFQAGLAAALERAKPLDL
jgi:NAD-dependent DNA ligase